MRAIERKIHRLLHNTSKPTRRFWSGDLEQALLLLRSLHGLHPSNPPLHKDLRNGNPGVHDREVIECPGFEVDEPVGRGPVPPQGRSAAAAKVARHRVSCVGRVAVLRERAGAADGVEGDVVGGDDPVQGTDRAGDAAAVEAVTERLLQAG